MQKLVVDFARTPRALFAAATAAVAGSLSAPQLAQASIVTGVVNQQINSYNGEAAGATVPAFEY